MIVLDASAVLELLLNTTGGQQVAQRIASPRESLHAPHLLDIEVTQVLRRYTHTNVVPADVAAAALADLGALDVFRYGHGPFLPRMWELRDNLTAYDAAYVTLAETLDAPLLTFDAQLAGAPAHHATIELLPT